MKIIAWNINGLRSIIQKEHLINLIEEEKPTIICFGETKLTCPIVDTDNLVLEKIKDYKYRYYSVCNNKNGYSGTAIYSKRKPINVFNGLYDGTNNIDDEGRVITLEFNKFYLVHVYTPNSGIALSRLKYRVNTWDRVFEKWLIHLQNKKPIIVCGDLNVANEEIDIKNPKTNHRTAGFTDEERESFKKILSNVNLIDTYRYKHPNSIEYSFWTYRTNARAKNVGWRIDYFLVSNRLKKHIVKAKILTNIMGSDHAPVKLNLR